MPALKAIVFDLDDTLYLERHYALSGFRAVAEWAETNFGVSAREVHAELERLFEDGVRNNTFDTWLAAAAKSMNSIAAMVRAYRDHKPTIEPLPATRPLLQQLRVHYALGLMTDGYWSVQRKKLTALALEDCFDAVVFSDEHGRTAWKPSPSPYRLALTKLGASSHEAVYVADNPLKDYLGARRAGMWSIRVRTEQGVYRDLEPESPEHAPDAEIGRLEDLSGAVAAIEELIVATSSS